MLPELGHFALILALLTAASTGVLSLWGAQKNRAPWVALAKPGALALSLLVTFAYACLTWAFVHNDFSVEYVAQQSNTLLPLVYRIAAVWGGHEGSLLLWLLMLTWWTLLVRLFSRALPDTMRARVIGVLCLVAAGFLLFILCTSNPFLRLIPGVAEGRELNPMLQDPGLVIHPPLLYMGYVGFSVAYAFAVAALMSGKLDAAWARWSRPWTMAAWVFLTLGIAMGSWWAYYELGWGGWWFWDPVENASFMPWLAGTALIHSLAVTEKRGSFKNWTVLLAVSTFSLSLLGTFLVRSGVLTSVHAFASDPSRGIFILAFLVAVIGASLALFVWRAPKVGLGGRFGLFSRESLLLTNNVLFVVATGTVLLGTLYPLIIDALAVGKISVGPPYFNAVFVPIMAPLLFLIGVGPFARWKQASLPEVARLLAKDIYLAACLTLLFVLADFSLLGLRDILLVQLCFFILLSLDDHARFPNQPAGAPAGIWVKSRRILNRFWLIGVAVSVGLILSFSPLRQPVVTPLVCLGIFLACWIALTALRHFIRQARATQGNGSLIAAILKQPRHFWGMHIAHIGVAVFVAGVTVVGGYEEEKDVKMAPGDSVSVAGNTFRFLGVRQVKGPNYLAWQGDVELSKNDRFQRRLLPEKRIYHSSAMPMTEAAIDAGFLRDVYVSLGEPIDRAHPEAEWAVRVYYKPLVDWIWGGCILMALGGLIAMLDRRYRNRRTHTGESK